MFTNLAIPNWGTNQEAKLVRRHWQFKDKFRERLGKSTPLSRSCREAQRVKRPEIINGDQREVDERPEERTLQLIGGLEIPTDSVECKSHNLRWLNGVKCLHTKKNLNMTGHLHGVWVLGTVLSL